MVSRGYFEGQNGRDCVIHSLNNAFGFEVVNKVDVLRHINERVADLVEETRRRDPSITPRELRALEKKARSQYSDGKTFFAANVVWDAAREGGAYAVHAKIPGMASPFVRIGALLDNPVVSSSPVVLLGEAPGGSRHAVAARDGMLYDSERSSEGAVPISAQELKKSLAHVYGAYAFLQDPADVERVLKSVTWTE